MVSKLLRSRDGKKADFRAFKRPAQRLKEQDYHEGKQHTIGVVADHHDRVVEWAVEVDPISNDLGKLASRHNHEVVGIEREAVSRLSRDVDRRGWLVFLGLIDSGEDNCVDERAGPGVDLCVLRLCQHPLFNKHN